MPIPSEDVRVFAKHLLIWQDRHIGFRKALRTLPLLDTTVNERLVSLLPGAVLDCYCLLALTTEGIYVFRSFSDADPIVWNGADIVKLTVQQKRAIRIDFRPGLSGPKEVDHVEVKRIASSKVDTFVNLANVLCRFSLWGDPERFLDKWDTLKTKAQGTIIRPENMGE